MTCKRCLEILFKGVGIAVLVLIVYWLILDYVVYNEIFYDNSSLKPLYYLFPTIIALVFACVSMYSLKKIRILSFFTMTLSNVYVYLSFFMITGKYCEPEKNQSPVHIAIILILLSAIAYIHFKYILPRIKKKDLIIVSLATLVTIIDLFYTLFSFKIIYA